MPLSTLIKKLIDLHDKSPDAEIDVFQCGNGGFINVIKVLGKNTYQVIARIEI